MDNFNTKETYPQIYQIELTEKCNLQCPMCLNHMMKDKVDAEKELIDIICDNDYLKNTIYTEFQFSGEPTLSPILDYAIDRVKATKTLVGLSTNLSTVKKCIESLKKLDCITVSFDIFDKEIYEQTRYPQKFETFIDNFLFLMNNLTKNTLVEIQLIKSEWSKNKYDEVKKNLLAFLEENAFSNITIREIGDSFVNYHGKGDSDSSSEMCLNPFYTVSIKADGTVVPCSVDFFKEIPLGNLYKKSLDEIWNSPNMDLFRLAHRSESGLPKKCKECYGRSPIIYMNKVIIQQCLEYKLSLLEK